MHELVKHLVSDTYYLLDKPTKEVDPQTRHVSFIVDLSWEAPSWLYDAKLLKTLLFFPSESCRFITIPNINDILANLKSLQALDLAIVNCGSYPGSIGKLKQLRYLRLGISFNSLPECITNLKYLSTLDLRHTTIQELPESFHQLHCLRHLYTGGRLIDLPPRFNELTQLITLDVFIVGENNGFRALANLVHLAGKLKICYKEGHTKKMWTDYDLVLEEKHHKILVDTKLDDLSIVWSALNEEPAFDIEQEKCVMELEILQPPETVMSLAVQGWMGVSFPQWVIDDLVFLFIAECRRCQYLPSFSSLCRLESLQLWGLVALEWIEIHKEFSIEYFPSLKYLILANLPQLRRWFKVEEHDTDFPQQEHENEQNVPQKILNSLLELRVRACPKLTSMPLVPSLATFDGADIHEKLLKHVLSAQQHPASSSDSSASHTLKDMHINFVHELRSLSINITSLRVLTITECKELTDLSIDSNSLKQLKIRACPRLKDISHALHNLSVLEELEIGSCEELDWACMIDDIEKSDEDSLRAAKLGLNNLHYLTVTNISKPEPLPKSFSYLRTLKELSLYWLYNMTLLPESIGHLTQLCRLVIRYCPKLKKLPESFPNLKSLKQLEIKECPKVERRCKQPYGEDCILIDHIPNVHLG